MPRKVHRCLVGPCKKELDDVDILYHKITKTRYERWMKALGRNPDEKLACNNVICSKHFVEEDYILKNGIKVLKANAIPSKNLPLFKNVDIDLAVSSSSISPQIKTTAKKRLFTEMDIEKEVVSSPTKKQKVTYDVTTDSDVTHVEKNIAASSSDSDHLKGSPKLRKRDMKMVHNYSFSPRRMQNILKTEKVAKKKLQTKYRSLKVRQKRLRTKVYHLKSVVSHLKKEKLINEDVEEILGRTFSGIPLALMKRMLGNAKRGKITREKYPETLRSFAMTLQFYSSKGYNYVRKIFDLALPSPSVIRSWMTNINCGPGFNSQSFKALKEKVRENDANDSKTVCCLMLDEMHIRKQIDFANNKTWGYINLGTDIDNDELQEAKEALVLMVVAINGHWKIPIAYFFINSLKSEDKANILKQALIMLHEVKVIIAAITCDGPTVNFAMMAKLGAEIENVEDENDLKTYFYHPSDKRLKVYVVFDVCHMIKLLRNNWATLTHFKDPDGNLVSFAFITYLFDLQEDENFRFGTKLRKVHMDWKTQKMKVNLAVQIFSSSVADALEFLMTDMQHPLFAGAEATIKFIRLVDSLFDLLNSRSIIGYRYKIPIKSENRDKWEPIFMTAIKYFTRSRTIDNKLLIHTPKKTPFKGFIITINSIIGIFETYVIQELFLRYILTYKVSQDHLELFFCSIRSRNGWNNNPSALQFFYTYRRLLIHNEIKSTQGNVIMQDATSVLFTTASKKKIVPITSDDINIIRKYDLDITDQQVNDHDYAIPISPTLSLLAENVVSYMAGFVIKIAKKFVKCSICLSALELQSSIEDNLDPVLKLIKRKRRGNLIIPSNDVTHICIITEKKIRTILNITDGKLPNEDNFFNTFCQQISLNILESRKCFQSFHKNHEILITDENHISRLIKIVVHTYVKIRFYNMAKKISYELKGELIRKKFTKLVLFNNQ